MTVVGTTEPYRDQNHNDDDTHPATRRGDEESCHAATASVADNGNDDDDDDDDANHHSGFNGAADILTDVNDTVGSVATVASAAVASASAASAAAAAESTVGTESSTTTTMMEAMWMVETLTSVYGFTYDAANEAVNVNSSRGTCTIQSCCDYILDNGLGYDAGGAIAPITECPHVIDPTTVSSSASRSSQSPTIFSSTLEAIPNDIFDRPCSFYSQHDVTTDTTSTTATGQSAAAAANPENKAAAEKVQKHIDGDGMCPKGENWLCLTCREVFCSRYVNGHGVRHWEESRTATTSAAADDDDDDVAKLHPEKDTASTSSPCLSTNHRKTSHGHGVMISMADLSVWCHVCNSYIVNEDLLQPIVERLQHLKFSKLNGRR